MKNVKNFHGFSLIFKLVDFIRKATSHMQLGSPSFNELLIHEMVLALLGKEKSMCS